MCISHKHNYLRKASIITFLHLIFFSESSHLFCASNLSIPVLGNIKLSYLI